MFERIKGTADMTGDNCEDHSAIIGGWACRCVCIEREKTYLLKGQTGRTFPLELLLARGILPLRLEVEVLVTRKTRRDETKQGKRASRGT